MNKQPAHRLARIINNRDKTDAGRHRKHSRHKGLGQLIIGLFCIGLIHPYTALAADTIELSPPPTSLAKWYKPANKRQVWLHTMFRLRREIQAVQDYSAEGDHAAMQKWAKKLAKDYRSLPDMVPEWRDDVDLSWADRMLQAAEKNDKKNLKLALRKLKVSCKSCHKEYRAIVAATYRSPDYKKLMVPDSKKGKDIKFKQAMNNLSHSVNRIMIALQDDRREVAHSSSQLLNQQLNDLGSSCQTCHKDPGSKTRILGQSTSPDMEKLWQSMKQGDTKLSQRQLGHLSVNICARCHGIHRTLAGLREMVLPEKGD